MFRLRDVICNPCGSVGLRLPHTKVCQVNLVGISAKGVKVGDLIPEETAA